MSDADASKDNASRGRLITDHDGSWGVWYQGDWAEIHSIDVLEIYEIVDHNSPTPEPRL